MNRKWKPMLAFLLTVVMLGALTACANRDQAQQKLVESTAAAPTPDVAPTLAPAVQTEAPAPTAAPTAEPTPEPTPEPTAEPTPAPQNGTARVDGIGIVVKLFNRGDEVTLTGEQDDYYIVALDDGDVLVEKELIRLSTERDSAETNAYANSETRLYDNPYLEGTPIATLSRNTQVTVIDSFGGRSLVRYGEQTGFMKAGDLAAGYQGNYYYNGGSTTGVDGGDITLGAIGGTRGRYVSLAAVGYPKTGKVLADGTEGYLRFLKAGETVTVIEIDPGKDKDRIEGDEKCILSDSGRTGTVPRWEVILEGDEPYQEWTGYSVINGELYDNYRLLGKPIQTLRLNSELKVIFATQDVLVVKTDTDYAYIAQEDVTEKPTVYSGGGGGNSEAEWTAPVL